MLTIALYPNENDISDDDDNCFGVDNDSNSRHLQLDSDAIWCFDIIPPKSDCPLIIITITITIMIMIIVIIIMTRPGWCNTPVHAGGL